MKIGTIVQDHALIILTQSYAHTSNPLAPPTCQSWSCILARTFRALSLIFKNEMALDSLAQAESDGPYPIITAILDRPPYWILCKTHKNLL